MPLHVRSKNFERVREAIKKIDSIGGNSAAENDKDLQLMLPKCTQLISYTSSDS